MVLADGIHDGSTYSRDPGVPADGIGDASFCFFSGLPEVLLALLQFVENTREPSADSTEQLRIGPAFIPDGSHSE